MADRPLLGLAEPGKQVLHGKRPNLSPRPEPAPLEDAARAALSLERMAFGRPPRPHRALPLVEEVRDWESARDALRVEQTDLHELGLGLVRQGLDSTRQVRVRRATRDPPRDHGFDRAPQLAARTLIGEGRDPAANLVSVGEVEVVLGSGLSLAVARREAFSVKAHGQRSLAGRVGITVRRERPSRRPRRSRTSRERPRSPDMNRDIADWSRSSDLQIA